MTLRERFHWILRMSLMLFILASLAFLSALTAMRYAVQGREVRIPDLVGEKVDSARHMLELRGIEMKIEDKIYSGLPVDAVVRQSPPPNMTVKIGQFEHVVLSLGPQKETIPPLEESSLRAARIALLRSGMQVGEVSSAYLPGAPSDTVLEQDPAPGTSEISSHVNFLLSLGPRPPAYVMPDLTGLQLSEADSKLSSAAFKVAKTNSSSMPGAAHGTVVGQTPPRGQRIDADASIELQVAD